MDSDAKLAPRAAGRTVGGKMRKFGMAGLIGALFLAACDGSAQRSEDWAFHGHDPQEQRYSPLDEVNRDTVKGLGLAWYHEFSADRGQEATPLVKDGVLYTSTSWSEVFAFDAATGRLLWSYDPKTDRASLVNACCDAINRGVALWGDRVFVATLDGRLISLDAKTGRVAWSVDTIDRRHPGMHYTITGAPRVANGKIVIGNAGSEFGVRGYVTAYDAASGRQAWRFFLTPNPTGGPDGAASDEIMRTRGAQTWSDGEWKVSGGGGTAWDSMTFDPSTNLLFVGTGNGSPFDYSRRSGGQGDNLFLSSILALDPETGAYRWHYQTTPQDAWDYTAAQQMIAARLSLNGTQRDVLMQAPKNGFFYVLDRRTGQLLSAKPFAPVTWAREIDLKTGRPVFAPGVHYENGPAILRPGSLGAHSWQAMSYSPRTGLVYIPVQLTTGVFARDPAYKRRPLGQNHSIAMRAFPEDKDKVAAVRATMTGQLLAWDPVAQKPRWSVPHPWFNNGGTLVTAGDLVFQGVSEGKLLAYDATNGKALWTYEAASGIIAPPITYRVRGEQYVAVMVGSGGAGSLVGHIVPDRPRLPGRLMVFKLGGRAQAPPFPAVKPPPIDVSGVASEGDPEAGSAEYVRTCSVCHGANASVAYTADLRRSGALRDPQAWRAVVLEGALEANGMVGFAKILTRADAENIRAYVLSQARKAQGDGQ